MTEICKSCDRFIYEKKKIQANLVLNLAQFKIDNNKFNITNINNMKHKSKTWFWNENVNERGLDTKKKEINEKKKMKSRN